MQMTNQSMSPELQEAFKRYQKLATSTDIADEERLQKLGDIIEELLSGAYAND
jgi:hypothetical protein